MKPALFKVHKALHLPRNLHCYEIHMSRSTKYCVCHEFRVPRPQTTAPATKSALQATKYCHEVCTSRSTVRNVLRLPQNLYIDKKPLRLPAFATKSALWTTKARGFIHATKNDHRVPKCARHNESAVSKSTRRGPPDSASLCSRNALRRSM